MVSYQNWLWVFYQILVETCVPLVVSREAIMVLSDMISDKFGWMYQQA